MSSEDAATAGRPARVPASVHTIEHAWIPMPDGTRLAARIWLPEDAGAASSGGGRSAGAGAERGGGTSTARGRDKQSGAGVRDLSYALPVSDPPRPA